jgi:predicted phage terminase large subunit-like protein
MTEPALKTSDETLLGLIGTFNLFQAEDRLSGFVRGVLAIIDPGTLYKHNWHVDLICEYLEAAWRREIRRLVINIPPRFMKSTITTIAWPAWILGHNPSEQIICASYSSSLAIKHSVECRLVIQSLWYRSLFPDVMLTGDMNVKSEFVTTKRGHRIATSVGGTTVGKGGNILIGDDILSPEQALSDTVRQTANDWIDQTFLTRFNDEKTGVFVNVQHRLHEADPTGHLIEKGGFTVLSIPMEAEKRTIIDFGSVKVKRKAGGLLHLERFGKAEVAQKKRDVGSYAWAGQYQQRPAPLVGGMIQLSWFKRYKVKPRNVIRRIQSWDTAGKGKEINNPSVCGTWLETEKGYYLEDVYRNRIGYPGLKRAAKSKYKQKRPDLILIEDKSSGEVLIQDLREDPEDHYPIKAIMPVNDKITRMSTASPTIEAGLVWLPENAPWLADFELEISNFPNSETADQVDMVSQFLNYVKKRTRPRVSVL